MQDFYILQRSDSPLKADEVKKWYYTVNLLAPDGILAGDDDTTSLMLGIHLNKYLYIIPLVRHLSADEAEKIVEGYMRVTAHDFEIETSNVYQANANFGIPFEYDISMDDEARNILLDAVSRKAHNAWILEQMEKGWRFGLDLDIANKTHPCMRPWDDLPESYKRYLHRSDKDLVDYYSKNTSKF